MLPTDQSHLRKYLATLGVAVVAAVVSLCGLALRLQDDLLVKESELRELTPLARDTIEQRQRFLATVTDVLPWFLLGGIVGGAALTTYGLAGWSQRQRIADRREDLGMRREEIEVERLTPGEQQERRDREAASALAEGPPPPRAPDPVIDRVATVERELASKLTAALGSDRVATGIRVRGRGGMAEFDAMVDLDSGTAVIELKYFASDRALYRRIAEAQLLVANLIGRVGHVITRGIVVAVVADAHDVPSAFPDRSSGSVPIDVHVFSEREFFEMPPEEFKQRLGL